MADDSPVLVYQVGKVASSSVVASLQQMGGFTVYQVHRLNPANIDRIRSEHYKRGWAVPDGDRQSEELYHQIFKPRLPARIITLVREPIGRNLSYYFQNLDKIWNTPNAHEVIPLVELIRGLPVEYPYSDDPLRWFDYEFHATLGVDVYTHPFNKAKGIQEISSPPYRILILRTDISDRAKSKALGRFLGIRKVPLVSVHRTADKNQGPVYRAFLDSLRMVPAYVDHMLGSEFCHHFFDRHTLESLRKKYLMGGTVIPEAFRNLATHNK